VAADTTDIVVWVHGWQNTRERAESSAARLFACIERLYAAQPDMYPGLKVFHPMFVAVRWPSVSNPFPWGYRKIRNRAHRMTTQGYAHFALAELLGYLDARRTPPPLRSGTLRTGTGQYLHCVGHSFGGRFLGEAVNAAPEPVKGKLPLLPTNPHHRFTVDSMLIFQMAARRDVFTKSFRPLVETGPLQGPICLTYTPADRACALWHPLAEAGRRAVGAAGALGPADKVRDTRLLAVDERYPHSDLASPIVNVDASRRYRRGRFTRPEGAHSDFWYPESIHLLLTLADYARPAS
jgi:hypothetical protein